MTETKETKRIREILATVKPLAAEYYRLTGKPLGVTGEVAEYVAAEHFGLELVPPRTPGHDAIRNDGGHTQRIEIKGRAFGDNSKTSQRIGKLKQGADCDSVLLVLMDNATLEPREMWEAPYAKIEERLKAPGSKSREAGRLSVGEFKRVAKQVWPPKK